MPTRSPHPQEPSGDRLRHGNGPVPSTRPAVVPEFPLERLRLNAVAQGSLRLPPFAGSMLRGAFGHALKKAVCITRESHCAHCSLYHRCPYPALFEPPPPRDHQLQRFSQIPAPYVIEPPIAGERHLEAGESFDFHLVLMGHAVQQRELILAAWDQALRRGLGKQRAAASLQSVESAPIDGPAPGANTSAGASTEAHRSRLTMHLQTPLRLQQQGRALRPEALDAERLLMALTRRIALISEFHGGRPPDWDFAGLKTSASGIESHKSLRWQSWSRYSSRQKQAMQLAGVTGTWTLEGHLHPFVAILYAGQWLHAGKNATFGLGQYRLIPAAA